LEHLEKKVEKLYINLKPLLFGYILQCDWLSGQGMLFQFLCHVWTCPVIDGRQWRRFEHVYASYPGHARLL